MMRAGECLPWRTLSRTAARQAAGARQPGAISSGSQRMARASAKGLTSVRTSENLLPVPGPPRGPRRSTPNHLGAAMLNDPASVTVAILMAMGDDNCLDWIASLTPDQYNMLSGDVQRYVIEHTTDDQKRALGIDS